MDKPFADREKELLLMNKAINNKCKEMCAAPHKSVQKVKSKENLPKKSTQIQHHCPMATKPIKKPIASYIGTKLALTGSIEAPVDTFFERIHKQNEIEISTDKQQSVTTLTNNNEYPQVVGKKSVSAEGLIKYGPRRAIIVNGLSHCRSFPI